MVYDYEPIPLSNDWNDLQKRLSNWADKTFPGSTLVGKFDHVKEELEEIILEPDNIVEWADAFMIMMHSLADRNYTMDDLFSAIERKHAINLNRKWGPPDANGKRNHIRE